MPLNDVGMVAASTTRSSAYLQALVRNNVLPGFVLLLENSGGQMPGQLAATSAATTTVLPDAGLDYWSDSAFDPIIPVQAILDQHNVPYEISPNKDINDPAVVNLLAARAESVFIYSGFGGVILRQPLLSCGKHFLHVHGGYLPDFKGSTTNYYSLLCEGSMGASAIFLSAEIDCGPILMRKSFPAPEIRSCIDHIYDSAARAKVLVDTLKRYEASKKWEFELQNNEGGETYYVIHPVLKHIAILGKKLADSK